MIKYLCSVFVACAISAQCQDTTKISYTEEQDTLLSQRFIDRYENVFMTKVPTRHMFKVGVGQSAVPYDIYSDPVFAMNHELGYEYKISQGFSAGINASFNGSLGFGSRFNGVVAGNIYGRWYYDMKRRIGEGKSASNFSGNFISGVFERQVIHRGYKLPVTRAGVEFGMQRRFLNHGRLELAVGAYYQKSKALVYDERYYYGQDDITGASDVRLETRSSLSMAFGDWKATSNGQNCEVLRCDQSVNRQWKIMWPSLSIGTKFVQTKAGVGFEQKLNQSPFSVNVQVMADYYDDFRKVVFFDRDISRSNSLVNSSIQLRYYYLQKRKIRTGRGGNNLSGIYAGPLVEYITEKSIYGGSRKKDNQDIGFGLTYGFQKTLFNNFYIDINGSGSWIIFESKDFRASARVGFGLRF